MPILPLLLKNELCRISFTSATSAMRFGEWCQRKRGLRVPFIYNHNNLFTVIAYEI